MTRIHLLATLLFGLAPVAGAADDSGPLVAKNTAREAVERGLRIVQKAAASYPSHRSCFSCHHQTLPIFAMIEARERGVATDRDLLQAQADFSRKSFQERVESLTQGRGIGGGAMTVAYGLWALDLAGRKRDDVTEAMVGYLLKTQRREGNWTVGGRRPPLEESPVMATVLAAYEMKAFAIPRQREEVKASVARAKEWLAKAPLLRQEDRNARLWGLHWFGSEPDVRREQREAVLACQHDDGGWSSNDDLPSDAYATGQTLVLLTDADLPVSDPAFQRGLKYLLDTQQGDGSWKVETRARPVQVFFDNGDPHSKHQLISVAATCWAVAALAAALEPEEVATATAPPEPYDLVIRGGRLVDGTGNLWFLGDLAICGDRIAAVGRIDCRMLGGFKPSP